MDNVHWRGISGSFYTRNESQGCIQVKHSYWNQPLGLYIRSQGWIFFLKIKSTTWWPWFGPKAKKDTYKLGRPIYNLWGQCCCNKLLWWNPYCRIKINLKINPITFSSFYFFSFFAPLVELMRLFVNDGRGFYFFSLGYGHEKHKNYKNLVSMLIHGDLILRF